MSPSPSSLSLIYIGKYRFCRVDSTVFGFEIIHVYFLLFSLSLYISLFSSLLFTRARSFEFTAIRLPYFCRGLPKSSAPVCVWRVARSRLNWFPCFECAQRIVVKQNDIIRLCCLIHIRMRKPFSNLIAMALFISIIPDICFCVSPSSRARLSWVYFLCPLVLHMKR